MEGHTYGLISLVPIAIIIAAALITKKTFQSILYGTFAGFLILGFGETLRNNPFSLGLIWDCCIASLNFFIESLYSVMGSKDTNWVMLVVSLIGALIALMERSGGVLGFADLAGKGIKSRFSAVMGTWFLGIMIFFDDYLNSLAIGASMRNITDRFKISREMLAYIVNSTGVTVCSIVPFSSWSAFMTAQMDTVGMVPEGVTAQATYIATMPYIFYGWIAVFLTPLFALKVLPLFGPIKKAEARAAAGQALPDSTFPLYGKTGADAEEYTRSRAINFLVPMLSFALVAVLTEDILYGIFAGLGLCLVLYLPQKIMTLGEFCDCMMKGIIDMIPICISLMLIYTMQESSKAMGLTEYIIALIKGGLPPQLLPVVTFIVVGFIAFASGTFWGTAAIAFPIILPLANALGVDPYLCAGALISAVTFGGHICIYSDAVIMSCASTQITNADYFETSLPLVLVPTVLTIIILLVLGYTM